MRLRSLCVILAAALACGSGAASAQDRAKMLEKFHRQAEEAARGNTGAQGGVTRSIAVFDGRAAVTGEAQSAAAAPAPQGNADGAARPERVAARPGEPTAEPPVVADENRVDLRITFETNSAFIRPTAEPLLQELCAAIKGSPETWSFNIIGHADASGSPEINRRLSAARAREVSRYLGARCGVAESRLIVYGLGSSRLLPDVPAVSEENRRVEVSINTI